MPFHDSYRQALILAAPVVIAAAAAVLRIGFPHHMAAVRRAVPVPRSAPAETVAMRADRP